MSAWDLSSHIHSNIIILIVFDYLGQGGLYIVSYGVFFVFAPLDVVK